MLGFPLHRGQASGMQCGDVCSATDPQPYGWSGIFMWLTCAGPAAMLGFPLHRGQASGMQCGDVCSATAPQLKGWGGIANSCC